MTDIISTFLMFESPPEKPLPNVLTAAIGEGWTVQTEYGGDNYEYMVGDDLRTATMIDRARADIDTSDHTSITVEKDGVEVVTEKDTDLLPIVGISNLYLWSNKYNYEYNHADRSTEQARANVDTYLNLIELTVSRTDQGYEFGKFGREVSPRSVPTVDDIYDARIRDVFWLNAFDQTAVERFGREPLARSRVEDSGVIERSCTGRRIR